MGPPPNMGREGAFFDWEEAVSRRSEERTLTFRTAKCYRCDDYTHQELVVGPFKHIYTEAWICVPCSKGHRGVPVVHTGRTYYLESGTMAEAIKARRKELQRPMGHTSTIIIKRKRRPLVTLLPPQR